MYCERLENWHLPTAEGKSNYNSNNNSRTIVNFKFKDIRHNNEYCVSNTIFIIMYTSRMLF